jgi:tyrosyl-tRNA synthetase
MQGYDSVAMDVDVEVCGTDQIFNALAGRDLIKKIKGKEKFVVAVTLMENPKTGELMSKSRGTGVFLDAEPAKMYGQIMAQPDEMVEILFINNTYLSLAEIKTIISGNPRDSKARLAFEIVKIFYGEKEAKKAQDEFEKVFRNKELPSDMPVLEISGGNYRLLDLLCLPAGRQATALTTSKKEAKRLIEAGAVDIDNVTEKDWRKFVEAKDGMVIKVGSRKFIKIKTK